MSITDSKGDRLWRIEGTQYPPYIAPPPKGEGLRLPRGGKTSRSEKNDQIVPVMRITAVAGVMLTTPVSGSCVICAAGREICPAAVWNTPVPVL